MISFLQDRKQGFLVLKKVRIGTRKSPMAMAQANFVKDLLEASNPGISVDIAGFVTTGDKFLNDALSAIGGKGLFTKEVEHALLDNQVDLAVHCAKDMPVEGPDGLEISGVLPGEDPRDCFVSTRYSRLEDMPVGARIGTASLRRQVYVKKMRPDLRVSLLRGSVSTRIKKLETEFDGTIMALCGLQRLGLDHLTQQIFDPKVFVPAAGQGILVLQTRVDDGVTKVLTRALNCTETAERWYWERVFMKTLNGSCRMPIAGYAELGTKGKKSAGDVTFRGMVGDADTLTFCEGKVECSGEEAETAIQALAKKLIGELGQKKA